MKIKSYVRAKNSEEAYNLMNEQSGTVLGGGTWLKLLPKSVEVAVDIKDCGLDSIVNEDGIITIGSQVTLRMLEISPHLQGVYSGMLSESARHIMGVPFRNIATIGGTIIGHYGFSDLLTPLLLMNATLRFYKYGDMSLEDYLEQPLKKDLLLGIHIPVVEAKGDFRTLKKTSTDFPIINVSVAKVGSQVKVAVGARPGVAKMAKKAMKYLNGDEETTFEKAADIACEELSFGTNARGSAMYRETVCKTLIYRCLKEVSDES